MSVLRLRKEGDRMELECEDIMPGVVAGTFTATGKFTPVIVSRDSTNVPGHVTLSGTGKTIAKARENMLRTALDTIDTVGT